MIKPTTTNITIDKENEHILTAFDWSKSEDGTYYAVDIATGQRVLLHRLISGIGLNPAKTVIYLNGDKDDLRKENLRVIIKRDEEGIFLDRSTSNWRAWVRYQNRPKVLEGLFDSITEAREVRQFVVDHIGTY